MRYTYKNGDSMTIIGEPLILQALALVSSIPVAGDGHHALVLGVPGDPVDPPLVLVQHFDFLVLHNVENDGRVVNGAGDQKSGARAP